MSRRAVPTGLEGIDRVSGRGWTDIRLEAVAVHHVDGTIKQARDVILEASIVEHGEMRLRIDFDHDVDIAARTAVAARHRAEPSRPAHATRAEIRFGSTQGFKGFAAVHKSKHSTKSRSAGEPQRRRRPSCRAYGGRPMRVATEGDCGLKPPAGPAASRQCRGLRPVQA